jgi:hypothetical protein
MGVLDRRFDRSLAGNYVLKKDTFDSIDSDKYKYYLLNTIIDKINLGVKDHSINKYNADRTINHIHDIASDMGINLSTESIHRNIIKSVIERYFYKSCNIYIFKDGVFLPDDDKEYICKILNTIKCEIIILLNDGIMLLDYVDVIANENHIELDSRLDFELTSQVKRKVKKYKMCAIM